MGQKGATTDMSSCGNIQNLLFSKFGNMVCKCVVAWVGSTACKYVVAWVGSIAAHTPGMSTLPAQ